MRVEVGGWCGHCAGRVPLVVLPLLLVDGEVVLYLAAFGV